MAIHPTAVLHPSLEPPADLEVGPYAVVDRDVILAPGVRIGPFCHVYPGTIFEPGVRLEDGVSLGNLPQDLKYRGEATAVRVGAGAWLREYVTVNRATAASGTTHIGPGALIMAYAHVAHDCEIGERAVIANGVQMGGHVRVGPGAVVSGMTGIHQFVSVGAGAFVGGNLRVDKDVLPFSKALGEPLRYAGLNAIGLARAGFGPDAGDWLRDFYRAFSEAGKAAALAAFREGGPGEITGGGSGILAAGAADVRREAGPGPEGRPGDFPRRDAEAARLRAILADFLGGQTRGLLTRPSA